MKSDELISIIKRLYKEHVKRYLKKILLCLALSLLVAGSTAGTAWLLDPAVKKIFIDKDKTLAWLIPLGIIFTFTLKGVSLYFARLNIIKVGASIGAEFQKRIMNTILHTDIQTLDNRHSGKYISNIMYDTSQIVNLVSTGVLNLMKDSFTVIALTSLMFYQNWKLAIFAIFMMPLAAVVSRTLGKRIGKATTEASEISGKMMTYFTEVFRASRMIRIYQKEKTETSNASNAITNMLNKNIKIAVIMIRATPIMETLTGFMIAGFIYYAGRLIDSGEIEVNNFFSFLAAMMLAYQPIRSLASINMIAYQATAAAKRIFTVIDAPVEIKNDTELPDLLVKKCEIEFLKTRFNSSHYYFISDLDSFIFKIQKALSEDLKRQPLLSTDVPRVVYPAGGNVFIYGCKDIVKYTDDSTNYIRTECETLSEYINSKRSRALDRALWFKKQKRFKEDSEFRIIFYACNKRGEGAETYTTNDDYLILPVDLTGSISKKALPIE